VEAAAMMGFLKVSEGDAEIVAMGRAFVEADIPRRKELFRDAALEHATLLRQITRSLKAKSDHTLTDDFFHDLLDEHFTEGETVAQLETATYWGRYSELFDHDSAGKFFFIPERVMATSEGAADSSS
jgi:NitT/TauT family transport system ATP-binding protein